MTNRDVPLVRNVSSAPSGRMARIAKHVSRLVRATTNARVASPAAPVPSPSANDARGAGVGNAAAVVAAAGGGIVREPEPEGGEPPHLAMCFDTEGNEFMLTRRRGPPA